MKKNVLFVVLAFPLLFAGCRAAVDSRKTDRPRGLTAEYRENPCGIDAAAPRLGWKLGQGLGCGETDVAQAAYRVLVASSRERLDRDEGDLWDSGKVESGRSVGVEYCGAPLASSQRAFWKAAISAARSSVVVASPFDSRNSSGVCMIWSFLMMR